MIPKGTYRARATEAEFGFTNTGTEQVAVLFEVVEDGEFQGERITWFGFFTDATSERTIQALRVCGWAGDDLGDLRASTPTRWSSSSSTRGIRARPRRR